MHVDREQLPHRVRELSVAIFLEGEFTDAFITGDNSAILPTDTMKNTVYVLARKLKWDSIEKLAEGLANHFLGLLPQVSDVKIEIEQVPWQVMDGATSAFVQIGLERRTSRVQASRIGATFISGIQGLQILKTADSGFSGFLKDELTTLAETDDRLLGTVLDAEWNYGQGEIAFNDSHSTVRKILLDTFARHRSLSVQQTLFAMGEAVLAQVDAVTAINLIMPNKHCILFDLSRFGLDNANQIFVPIDEPSGYIQARVVR